MEDAAGRADEVVATGGTTSGTYLGVQVGVFGGLRRRRPPPSSSISRSMLSVDVGAVSVSAFRLRSSYF